MRLQYGVCLQVSTKKQIAYKSKDTDKYVYNEREKKMYTDLSEH